MADAFEQYELALDAMLGELFVQLLRLFVVHGGVKEAVEDERRKERRARAIDALLELRKRAPAVSDSKIHAAREKNRP